MGRRWILSTRMHPPAGAPLAPCATLAPPCILRPSTQNLCACKLSCVCPCGCSGARSRAVAMSWQAYVDDNLIKSGQVSAAGIYDLQGNPWAYSAGFAAQIAEVAAVSAHFAEPAGLAATGATIAGIKYMFVQGEANSEIYVKKGATGVVFCRCEGARAHARMRPLTRSLRSPLGPKLPRRPWRAGCRLRREPRDLKGAPSTARPHLPASPHPREETVTNPHPVVLALVCCALSPAPSSSCCCQATRASLSASTTTRSRLAVAVRPSASSPISSRRVASKPKQRARGHGFGRSARAQFRMTHRRGREQSRRGRCRRPDGLGTIAAPVCDAALTALRRGGGRRPRTRLPHM
jgi:profilin